MSLFYKTMGGPRHHTRSRVDVEDVDAEYKRITDMGVPVEVELRNEPWGDRHFVLRDPNGIGVDIVQQR